LAQKLGIRERITFTGQIPVSEVPRYLSIAEIALSYIPKTAMYETQPPLKTVEYMAAGLPVIATDTGGNKTYIQHRSNGYLTDDSQEAFAQAILALVQDASLRQDIRQRARSSVERFSVEHIVREQLMPLYQHMLAQAPKR
jgi:glycosyltransferase involved in cell wall biosynthesis